MKTKLLILFVIVFSSFVNAQEGKCSEKEKLLNQYLTDSVNKKALEVWEDVKVSCPSFSEKIYILGNKVLQYQIEIADAKDKESKVNDLLNLYDQFDKYFPNNKNGNYEKRALALLKNKVGKPEDLYLYLNQAFEKEKETFLNSQAIYTYFEMYFSQYKENNSNISLDELFDKYCAVSSLITENSRKFPFKKEEYNRVSAGIDLLMQNVITKENFISYAQKKLEDNNSGTIWLEATAKSLSVLCKNNPVFGSVAAKLDDVKPTSTSAYYLATYNLNIGNQEKAIEFFKKSAELSKDSLEKATIYYSIATILSNSDKATSEKMVLNALASNPSNGRYYIFLANLYANSVNDCGANQNERNAIFKLASNTVLKSVEVEPRLKPTADTMSAEYLKKMLLDTDSKVKTVKIGCWIQQTIKF
jgi:tetratricopeptide (TPR) repeat protein